MAQMWNYRLRRSASSASRVLLIAGPAMLAAALSGMKGIPDIPWWLIGGGVVGVFLLIGQAYAEYQHRAYDPTWAFKFDERFYGGEIKDSRCKAANVLKNNRGNLRRTDTDLEDIDDLLDFLE